MSEHEHDWKPMLYHGPGQYLCICGATGFRNNAGAVQAHKQRKDYTTKLPAQFGDSFPLAGTRRLGKRGPGSYG